MIGLCVFAGILYLFFGTLIGAIHCRVAGETDLDVIVPIILVWPLFIVMFVVYVAFMGLGKLAVRIGDSQSPAGSVSGGSKKGVAMSSRILATFLAIGLLCLGCAMWRLERHIHFQWSYKSMVEDVVRDMVKPEALKP
jgi:hypothetical protein